MHVSWMYQPFHCNLHENDKCNLHDEPITSPTRLNIFPLYTSQNLNSFSFFNNWPITRKKLLDKLQIVFKVFVQFCVVLQYITLIWLLLNRENQKKIETVFAYSPQNVGSIIPFGTCSIIFVKFKSQYIPL